MISIVGQHDQHTITSSGGVRHLLDASLTDKERDHIEAYGVAWSAYEAVVEEARVLGTDQRHLARELETTRFQVREIKDSGFAIGDEELLRDRAMKLRNAEELAASIDVAIDRFGDRGAGDAIDEAARALSGAAALDPGLTELHEQTTELLSMLSDINAEIVRYASELDTESAELEETEQRVALLTSLKRKYGDSLESVFAFLADAEAREEELATVLASADDINDRLAAAGDSLRIAGDALTVIRRRAAERISATALGHLTDLGFAAPIVEISVVASTPTRSGSDTITVLFASDAALTPGPVSAIASGGELSRLVLALTLASGGADTDVVAFDEIDAGIGGETALAMGQKLSSLAETRQVLCVTHLPQVAAFADKHFVVTRNGVEATIESVRDEHRSGELSRMLAGLSSSDKGKQHAEELLELAATTRSP